MAEPHGKEPGKTTQVNRKVYRNAAASGLALPGLLQLLLQIAGFPAQIKSGRVVVTTVRFNPSGHVGASRVAPL
jgi:hypothetical protein